MQTLTLSLRRGKTPLYLQLYTALQQQIRTGQLQAGERLPGKRRLAADLDVSVNTVDTAYGMLAAEGYIQSIPRSGFTVCKLLNVTTKAAPLVQPPVSTPAPQFLYDFTTSSIDTTLFPFKTWRRIHQSILSQQPQLLNHGERSGDEVLRRAIAAHLREHRGVVCGAHQVVVGAGMEYLLGLLARLFSASCFAVENPGYPRTAHILKNNGAAVRFVSLDAQGMSVQHLCKSEAQIAYITPSHQFPTGVTMPAARRYELLTWASQAPGRYIIEDDYDSEFRFDTKPLPSLQGMDAAGRVIYVGTFSKSLAPAFRIAYIVLPQTLVPRWNSEFGFYSCTVSRFEQHTLAQMMENGQFAAHLRRLRLAYRRRRDLLIDALRGAFPDIALQGTHTGLHLLAALPGWPDAEQLVQAAATQSVRCSSLSSYDAHTPHETRAQVVLGYAGLADDAIPPAVQRLSLAWNHSAS